VTRIYLSPPDVRGRERALVDAAIESNWLAPVGPDLARFEADMAAYIGVEHAVGLSSGTAALHLGLLELGVGPGDVVLVSDLTFAATVNAVMYVGAEPVFIDSDPATWTMSMELLREELEHRAARGPRPKAIVTVDLYGQCPDYDALTALADEHGIPIFEDAAEALGGTCRGRKAGSFGAAAVLSFNGNKIITTSGGGMLVTDHARLAQRVRHLSTQAREPVPHYEHTEVGYNYRLSNILAALGRAQLETLDERVAIRRAINARYRAGLGDLAGVDFMPEAPYGQSNCWLTCITIDPAAASFTNTRAREHLEAHEIESRPTWKPMHLQPVFKEMTARLDGTSRRIFETGLCLPSGSGLTPDQQDEIIELVRQLGR
jgi:dTDP-4-amino-4,6-dideoxygalactose transaminase